MTLKRNLENLGALIRWRQWIMFMVLFHFVNP